MATTPDLFDTKRVECPQCGIYLAMGPLKSILPLAVSMQVKCDCGLILEVAVSAP